MTVIGITGGVATGKTTVAGIFSSLLKAKIIDADEIVHQFLAPGTKIWGEIVKCFGKDILKNGSHVINRKKLGQDIFRNASKRKQLEDIIHPTVKKVMEEKLKQYKKNNQEWIIMDIPLLFETKMESLVDKIIVVVRNEDAQLETLTKEKKLSLNEAKLRIDSQLPLSEKIKQADFVVDNKGTLEDTERQIKEICTNLKNETKAG